MSARFTAIALLGLLSLSALAQPPEGVRPAVEDLRERLARQGADASRLDEERERWPEIEERITAATTSSKAALEEGGRALEDEIARLDRKATLRPTALNHYLHGRLLGLAGSYEKSRSALNRAIEINPYFYWAYRGMGTTYAAQKLFEQAEWYYRKAVELAPGDAGSRENLLIALVERGKFLSAEQVALEGLQRDATNARYRMHLARALMGQDRWRDAIPHLEVARREDPDSPLLSIWLGHCKLFSGDIDGALETLRERLEQVPGDWRAWATLAQVLVRQGESLHAAGKALQSAAEHCEDLQRKEVFIDRAAKLLAGPDAPPKRRQNQRTISELLNIAANDLELERRLDALRALSTVSPDRHNGEFLKRFLRTTFASDSGHAAIIALKALGRWATTLEIIGLGDSPYHQMINRLVPLLLEKQTFTDHHLVRGMIAHLLGRHGKPDEVLPILMDLIEQEEDLYAFRQTHRALNRLTYAYIGVGEPIQAGDFTEIRGRWVAWWMENRRRYQR